MTNVASLRNVERWYNEIIKNNRNSDIIIFVVGTKRELLCESVIHFIESEGIRIANKIGAEYWSVSAATGFMVEQLFTRIAVVNFENIIDQEMEIPKTLDSDGGEISSDDDESSSLTFNGLLTTQSNWNDKSCISKNRKSSV